MRLRLRLLWLLVSSLWRGRLNVLDDSVLSFTVLPNDIDVHKITDDRYAAIMDLGRIDLAVRAGFMRIMVKRNWVPLATSTTIRFRYPLKLFQRYQLRTRIIFWNQGTFYFRQTFERGGRILATGYVRATLLAASGPVSPPDLLAELGDAVARPEEPPIVARLEEVERLIHAGQKEPAA